MEQLFTNRKFHFCSLRNFRVFFLNGKRPKFPKFQTGIFVEWKAPQFSWFESLGGLLCSTTTGNPSSKYQHRRASALLRNIQSLRICMGKKPIVSVTYDTKTIISTGIYFQNPNPKVKYGFENEPRKISKMHFQGQIRFWKLEPVKNVGSAKVPCN